MEELMGVCSTIPQKSKHTAKASRQCEPMNSRRGWQDLVHKWLLDVTHSTDKMTWHPAVLITSWALPKSFRYAPNSLAALTKWRSSYWSCSVTEMTWRWTVEKVWGWAEYICCRLQYAVEFSSLVHFISVLTLLMYGWAKNKDTKWTSLAVASRKGRGIIAHNGRYKHARDE